ncbi:MAG: M56 family metallopeptidase [Adhaeribacter sp.]
MNKAWELIGQSATTQALGISLLHSLWQGAAIALALWLLLKLLKNHAAQTRYLMAVLALVLLCGTFWGTFFYYYRQINPDPEVTREISAFDGQLLAGSLQQQVNQPQLQASWLRLQQGLQQQAASIFIAWSLGFIFYSARFFTGLAHLQHLKHTSTPLPASWVTTMQNLQRKIGLSQQVRLLSAGHLSAPLTFGWLKPVIFFPISLLTYLPPNQVETILLHELAHIRQKDYLVSLFQAANELFLFFNPAFWYLSAVLDLERELACDDLVMETSGDAPAYARALASLAELSLLKHPASPALAAGRGKSALFERIKRIVHHAKSQPYMKSTRRTPGYYLAPLAIVFVLLANFIFEVNGSAQKNGPDRAENKGLTAATQPAAFVLPGDSVPSTQNKKQPGPSPAKPSEKTQQPAVPGSESKKEGAPAINLKRQGPKPLVLVLTAADAAPVAGQPDRIPATAELARTRGKQIADARALDPATIASIDVYKHTGASAFGEKGRNGVIVVTLKSGQDLESAMLKKAPEKEPSPGQPAQKNVVKIIKGKTDKQYVLVLEKPVAGIDDQELSQKTISQVLESGEEITDMNELDPQEIASMHVLKGASAKPFGDKGKNGVVLITLKKEKPDNPGTKPETGAEWLIYPNPSENTFRLNIALPDSQEIQITAYDSQNRLVATIAKGSFWKGVHEFEWDASHLKPGYYFISLTKGKTTSRKRVIVK